jgi:pyroglutamyl-peptidase
VQRHAYTLLSAIARNGAPIPCGFIHLPYLPRQVAAMLADARAPTPDAELASMDLATMERALRIALAIAARTPT